MQSSVIMKNKLRDVYGIGKSYQKKDLKLPNITGNNGNITTRGSTGNSQIIIG